MKHDLHVDDGAIYCTYCGRTAFTGSIRETLLLEDCMVNTVQFSSTDLNSVVSVINKHGEVMSLYPCGKPGHINAQMGQDEESCIDATRFLELLEFHMNGTPLTSTS